MVVLLANSETDVAAGAVELFLAPADDADSALLAVEDRLRGVVLVEETLCAVVGAELDRAPEAAVRGYLLEPADEALDLEHVLRLEVLLLALARLDLLVVAQPTNEPPAAAPGVQRALPLVVLAVQACSRKGILHNDLCALRLSGGGEISDTPLFSRKRERERAERGWGEGE